MTWLEDIHKEAHGTPEEREVGGPDLERLLGVVVELRGVLGRASVALRDVAGLSIEGGEVDGIARGDVRGIVGWADSMLMVVGAHVPEEEGEIEVRIAWSTDVPRGPMMAAVLAARFGEVVAENVAKLVEQAIGDLLGRDDDV